MSKLYEATLDEKQALLVFAEKEREFEHEKLELSQIIWKKKKNLEHARLDYLAEPTITNLRKLNEAQATLRFWLKEENDYYGYEAFDADEE